MFVCLYVRKNNPLPMIQFQIWAQIWNPWAKVDVLRLFAHWSDHKSPFIIVLYHSTWPGDSKSVLRFGIGWWEVGHFCQNPCPDKQTEGRTKTRYYIINIIVNYFSIFNKSKFFTVKWPKDRKRDGNKKTRMLLLLCISVHHHHTVKSQQSW